MILDTLKIGNDLGLLLKQRVAQGIYDTFTGISTSKGSLSRQGNITKIVVPCIASDDMPMDYVTEVAQGNAVKVAMDAKTFLEQTIKDSPQEVNIATVMRSIPITVLNKGAGTTAAISDILKDRLNTSVSERLLTREALEYEIEKKAIMFSDVDIEVQYSEAPSGNTIINDRNALPVTVNCEIKYITGKGEIKTVNYTISVECAPRYVNSNELRTRISSYSNKGFYKNFVRVEKGEINFLLDWMLDLKMLRYKAKAAAKGDASIFHVIDKYKLINDMGVTVYPFLTLLLSNNFVDELNTKEHLDIFREGSHIMKSFFAMGIYIYDQDMDVLHIRYDGDPDWKKYRFDDFARDTSKYERQLKELVKFNK